MNFILIIDLNIFHLNLAQRDQLLSLIQGVLNKQGKELDNVRDILYQTLLQHGYADIKAEAVCHFLKATRQEILHINDYIAYGVSYTKSLTIIHLGRVNTSYEIIP